MRENAIPAFGHESTRALQDREPFFPVARDWGLRRVKRDGTLGELGAGHMAVDEEALSNRRMEMRMEFELVSDLHLYMSVLHECEMTRS